MPRQVHPNSLANLKLFQKGQSGNPGGRRKRPITDEYLELGLTAIPEKLCKKLKLPEGSTFFQAGAMATVARSLKGDIRAMRELRHAVEGKETERIEISGPEGNKIEIEVTYKNAEKKREAT